MHAFILNYVLTLQGNKLIIKTVYLLVWAQIKFFLILFGPNFLLDECDLM